MYHPTTMENLIKCLLCDIKKMFIFTSQKNGYFEEEIFNRDEKMESKFITRKTKSFYLGHMMREQEKNHIKK